jgi:hypothetical protein
MWRPETKREKQARENPIPEALFQRLNSTTMTSEEGRQALQGTC